MRIRLCLLVILGVVLPINVVAVDWTALKPLLIDALGDDTRSAEAAWVKLKNSDGVESLSSDAFATFETRLGRINAPYAALSQESSPHRFNVPMPDGRELPVQVLRPPGYNDQHAWPLILAMHGGPNRRPHEAGGGAIRMGNLWQQTAAQAGWVLVTPAMTHVIARGPRTSTRLPYEIMTAPQMEALLERVGELYNIDPNRIIATGVSLGANFSIAYAAARPDRFAGILPVSSEGDSREHLIRNLASVASYSLQGGLDRSVRDRTGPRRLAEIQKRLGHRAIYREFPERGHEAFEEYYGEALDWLTAYVRDPFPTEVWRIPHQGIMPLAKRVHWLESDIRVALVHAKVVDRRKIVIRVHRSEYLTLCLHDRLLNLDESVVIDINGVRVFDEVPSRSILTALRDYHMHRDSGRICAAKITLEVPNNEKTSLVEQRLVDEIAPQSDMHELSFWERYAVQTLRDRFPTLGITGNPTKSPTSELTLPGQIGIYLTAIDGLGPFAESGLRRGDILLRVDGEPFFEPGGLTGFYEWLIRDLQSVPKPYSLAIERDGQPLNLSVQIALEPFIKLAD